MRHDEQVRLIKQLCAHLDGDTNVDAGGMRRNPTATYTDPDQADREWNEWFRAMPQLVGLSRDLPESGSFLTNNDTGTPILAKSSALPTPDVISSCGLLTAPAQSRTSRSHRTAWRTPLRR